MRMTSQVFSIIAVILILNGATVAFAENRTESDESEELLVNSEFQENESNEVDIDRTSSEEGSELHKLLGKELKVTVTHAELRPPKRDAEQEQRNEDSEQISYTTSRTAFKVDDDDAADDESEERDDDNSYNPWRDSFNDQFEDGSYVYGYSLPYGVRRFERSFYSEKYKGRVVEGFHSEPRHWGSRLVYELRCYRADSYGYRPLKVQYLSRPPIVRRYRVPNVTCFAEDTRN